MGEWEGWREAFSYGAGVGQRSYSIYPALNEGLGLGLAGEGLCLMAFLNFKY